MPENFAYAHFFRKEKEKQDKQTVKQDFSKNAQSSDWEVELAFSKPGQQPKTSVAAFKKIDGAAVTSSTQSGISVPSNVFSWYKGNARR